MAWRLLLLFTLATTTASAALAQGMSDEYLRERTRVRYTKPYGLGLELDVFGHAAYVKQENEVRSSGLPADVVSYRDTMDAPPFGLFLDVDLRLRFSWHDSIQMGYGLHILRAFEDLEFDTRFNGLTYPAGVDADYAVDWHDFRLLYRRDLFRLGIDDSFTTYLLAGLEWGIIDLNFSSDTFTVDDGRDRERFREMLPWYSLGLGFEWELGAGWRISAEGRGTYQVGVPTFQKRDDESMKQSNVSMAGQLALEWAVTDWFSLILRGKYRYMYAKVYGGSHAAEFLWTSYGPEIGIGFRF